MNESTLKENPFVRLRKVNIQRTKELIREKQPISHPKLMGLMMIEGFKESTISEYLEALVKAELIKYDDAGDQWSIKEDA